MPDRKIYCCECDAYVGTIRDAKLMKGLEFICPDCRLPDETPNKPIYGDGTVDYMMNLFGMNKGRR